MCAKSSLHPEKCDSQRQSFAERRTLGCSSWRCPRAWEKVRSFRQKAIDCDHRMLAKTFPPRHTQRLSVLTGEGADVRDALARGGLRSPISNPVRHRLNRRQLEPPIREKTLGTTHAQEQRHFRKRVRPGSLFLFFELHLFFSICMIRFFNIFFAIQKCTVINFRQKATAFIN